MYIVACTCLHNFAMARGDIYVDDGRVVNIDNDIFTSPETYPQRQYAKEKEVGQYQRRQLIKVMYPKK